MRVKKKGVIEALSCLFVDRKDFPSLETYWLYHFYFEMNLTLITSQTQRPINIALYNLDCNTIMCMKKPYIFQIYFC